MEKTAVWGGECELKAISTVLQRQIRIFQASGPTRVIGEGYAGDALLLSYHRHEFSLGEHYNAVRAVNPQ
jgi:OTU domain-containing protein 6